MRPEDPSTSKRGLANCLEQLRQEGCEIRQQAGGCYLVVREGCGAMVEEPSGGAIQFSVRPGLVRRDTILHLIDHGFQKFWQDGDRRIPARAEELKALHELQRDLRAAMGLTTLYNEALGTVSSKYVYDRVEGREPGKRHDSFD
jgi:hypothetical protein